MNKTDHSSEPLYLFLIPFPSFFVFVYLLLLLFTNVWSFLRLFNDFEILTIKFLIPFLHDFYLLSLVVIDMQGRGRWWLFYLTALFHGRRVDHDSAFGVKPAFGETFFLQELLDLCTMPAFHCALGNVILKPFIEKVYFIFVKDEEILQKINWLADW